MQTLDFRLLNSICPECKKKSVSEFYPFCSIKCRSIDLSRWLSDEYRIPIKEDEELEEDINSVDT
ncbi:DNA gyrase inhibitor YacG [Candidatus Liberibacter brunswickensis]|uniref:DNA gyrase inhibitor YacG n=1 Tax=Candidatus Liberibacter brunswickensis TaxID=1968796 RepID=UPI002FE3A305